MRPKKLCGLLLILHAHFLTKSTFFTILDLVHPIGKFMLPAMKRRKAVRTTIATNHDEHKYSTHLRAFWFGIITLILVGKKHHKVKALQDILNLQKNYQVFSLKLFQKAKIILTSLEALEL